MRLEDDGSTDEDADRSPDSSDMSGTDDDEDNEHSEDERSTRVRPLPIANPDMSEAGGALWQRGLYGTVGAWAHNQTVWLCVGCLPPRRRPYLLSLRMLPPAGERVAVHFLAPLGEEDAPLEQYDSETIRRPLVLRASRLWQGLATHRIALRPPTPSNLSPMFARLLPQLNPEAGAFYGPRYGWIGITRSAYHADVYMHRILYLHEQRVLRLAMWGYDPRFPAVSFLLCQQTDFNARSPEEEAHAVRDLCVYLREQYPALLLLG